MKGREAERVTAPLSLSPPAGSRGLWEGLLRWHLRKFLLRDGCRLQNLGEPLTWPSCELLARRDSVFVLTCGLWVLRSMLEKKLFSLQAYRGDKSK